MSDVLTKAQYAAIAEKLSYPSGAFINGAFQPAASGKTFDTVNPATGKVLTKVAACNADDVDYVTTAAQTAFDSGAWRSLAPAERKAIMLKFADLLHENRHELAVMESLDSGKPVRECQTIDVAETINTIRWHAELIDKIYDSTAPVGPDAVALIVREPIGVVGCVLPWNFPLLMLAWKAGPALAAGCSVVLKPAEQTSLTSLRAAELAFQAGIPAGVFNVITGTGRDVGEPIGLHNGISMVSFTGSTTTGRRFLRYAADSNLKRIVLECGGKNPAVVLADAEDLKSVAEHVINGAFWNMGENCSATSRLIVHHSIKDELLRHMLACVGEWKMGDPLDPENALGALVSTEHFAKVKSYIDLVMDTADKSNVVCGGHAIDGRYVEATIVDNVDPGSRIFQEEIFGPILAISTFNTVDEAIELANDTVYGLAASVYTGSIRHAMKLSAAIRAGVVTVNCYGEGDVTTPFGGYKESGFGGRDKSIYAHDQYTEIKTIWLNTSN
ncbi:aldehyde dehydrogenase [Komagataeibacter sp. FNDCF1]|uniref:aldehyde dehydrogenase n=1 Tax=Komagataeibacter sp. FNDCF1 TaxID=2878681 RepID=UPI001E39CB5A|nr:aldehyde dehydrogenase [Komagataeibacter sp. FNDCF1]MCE2564542.1 aldehyde dehydrogenase [Komagataeibacter sp. FNDCF1]